MTDQLRIRRKTCYLRDMVAILLDIGRNLIIFLIKQELMKLFYVVLQCLRDNAVTDLSNILRDRCKDKKDSRVLAVCI